jgi:hypothetical protein
VTDYRVAPDVAWVVVTTTAAPEAVAARVPDGPPLALHGSSALIWLSAVDSGDTRDVVDRVAEATGELPETVEQGVRDFLDDLVARGLLTSAPPAPRAVPGARRPGP